MIEATGLTKRYGATVAVDDLSFTVPPGLVTGFLGPNGAGVFCLYAAAALAAGFVLIGRRDA
jgi:ABC-type Na+ transport system ATPase subunit NatA